MSATCTLLGRERQEVGFFHELFGQTQHVGRIGRGEQEGGNPAFGQVSFDLPHVRVEADGKHAVGFVENEGLEVLQGEVVAQQVVENASRRPHHQVRSGAKGVGLRPVAHAAVDQAHAQSGVLEEHFGFAGHLFG
ncbi:hypothetical protein JCM15519_08710 [Fundidesulfovibrio butyratiphilus]